MEATVNTTKKKWLKAGLSGLIGSIVMLIIIQIAIHSKMAPFHVPPSAAMLIKLGMSPMPMAMMLHFLYGITGALLMVILFKDKVSIKSGILTGLGLWLIMMIFWSPMIGWGFFGFGHASALPLTSPLYLAPGPKFMMAALMLHLIYGVIIGGLGKKLLEK